jgi:hypothetical protein
MELRKMFFQTGRSAEICGRQKHQKSYLSAQFIFLPDGFRAGQDLRSSCSIPAPAIDITATLSHFAKFKYGVLLKELSIDTWEKR